MATKKPTATAKPKAAKPRKDKAKSEAKAPTGPTPLKDTGVQRTQSVAILPDHIYRGPYHGQDGVSDLRVVSVDDSAGTVTVEPTKPPNRQATHKVDAFQEWVVKDVTAGYEKIPGKRRGDA